MKLTIPNGVLTLPKDFKFEIEVSNPFFSDEGTSSLPVNLPATSENLRLLGFPNRICRGRRYIKEYSAVLSHGPFSLSGTLIIDSVSDNGITCVLSLTEGALYAKYQDKNLRDFMCGHHFYMQWAAASSGEFHAFAHLWDIYINHPDRIESFDGLSIFPVQTTDGYSPAILNLPNEDAGRYDLIKNNIVDGDGHSVSVPDGYGTTPFIYLWKLIAQVLELCNYKVGYNVFADPAHVFSKIVVLNSCADSMVGGYVRWDNIVPSVTIGELIVWLKDKFGAGIFIDGGKAEIRLLQDCLTSQPDIDLSNYVRGELSIAYPSSSRVVISCDTSIDGAEPPTETLQDLQAHFPSLIIGSADSTVEGFHFNKTTGRFYRMAGEERIEYGSNTYSYDRKNSVDTDERSAEDSFVPMVESENGIVYPVVGKRIHVSSEVKGSDEDLEQKIMICWSEEKNGRRYGTTQGEHPLTPEGLYPLCWDAYNRLLLNSAPEIEAQLDLPVHMLLGLDLSRPKLLGSQKVMIKSYSFIVGNDGVSAGKMTMQSMPKFRNEIEDNVIDLDSFYPLIGWQYVNTVDDRLRDLGVSSYVSLITPGQYTSEDTPQFEPKSVGIVAMRRTRIGQVVYRDFLSGSLHRTIVFDYEEYFLAVARS